MYHIFLVHGRFAHPLACRSFPFHSDTRAHRCLSLPSPLVLQCFCRFILGRTLACLVMTPLTALAATFCTAFVCSNGYNTLGYWCQWLLYVYRCHNQSFSMLISVAPRCLGYFLL